MAVTRDDAMITKGRAQVAGIRNAITLLRNTNMLQARGAQWPVVLDDAANNTAGEELFDGNATIGILLDYPLYARSSDGNWMKTANNAYDFRVMRIPVPFTYDGAGKFDCTHGAANTTVLAEVYCKSLTE
jgi:general secretion pathway protein G